MLWIGFEAHGDDHAGDAIWVAQTIALPLRNMIELADATGLAAFTVPSQARLLEQGIRPRTNFRDARIQFLEATASQV
jgi:hypothetical protein